LEAEDERVIYAVARELTTTGRLGQENYDAAQRLLGDAAWSNWYPYAGITP